ncbi:MAG: glycosyltransferase [Candidatus Scalinduaceae bacterium]
MGKICKEADIVIGIPSLNEADNIAFVTRQLALGLKTYFPTNSAIIINVDNNSKDGTKEAFLGAETGNIPKKYISTGEAAIGKGNNIRNLLIEVVQLKAKSVIVVDADLKSINPEWVKTLATPILEGYDFVTPIYTRNEYDGTITNHITYPLIYSIFKANIRQPIGGDFSFSPRTASYWLRMAWERNTRQYGIDIFMTTSALLNGFRVCQVLLGSKVHKPSAPKLGSMFTQVVTTLFSNISRFRETWMHGNSNKECPILGDLSYEEPQSLSVDYKYLKKVSFDAFSRMDKMILNILSPSHYHITKKMYLAKRWNIGSELWAKKLYDFIFAYEVSENKEDVVEALKPLYFARVASFYRQTMEMSHQEAEEKILMQAKMFKNKRGYLVKKFTRENGIDAYCHKPRRILKEQLEQKLL